MKMFLLVLLVPLCLSCALVYTGPASTFFKVFYLVATAFYSTQLAHKLLRRRKNQSPNRPQ